MKNSRKKETKKETKKSALKEDTIFWILLALIITSGMYFRLTDYAAEGIKNDAPTVLTGGLLWFYPHNFYPGLMQYHPPVANYLIAAGCMASGEDFSRVSNASPYFLPNIAAMIGEPYAKAENYCHAPVYISSILVFIGLILLSFTLLEKKEALFATAFFAFNAEILAMGRLIYTWTFVWLFSAYGLLSLWKFYDSKKGSKNELIYAGLAGIIFGLGLAAKFTLALFLPFCILMIIEKYRKNIINNGKIKVPIPLIKSLAVFSIIFTITTLYPYQFSLKNLIDTYSFEPHTSTTKTDLTQLGTFRAILGFATYFNPIDLILFIVSCSMLYNLIFSKEKTKKEKFIYYNILLFIFVTTFFPVFRGSTRTIAYFFGIALLMSKAMTPFIGKISSYTKISKKTAFYVIMILYVTFNVTNLYDAKPYYMTKTSEIYCKFSSSESCETLYPVNKAINLELEKILKENETFYDTIQLTSENYFYLRQEDFYNIWYLGEYIKKYYNTEPTIYDIIRNFNFDNRTIKYLVIRSKTKDIEEKSIISTATPISTVIVKDTPVAFIYDVETLPKIVEYRKNTQHSIQ